MPHSYDPDLFMCGDLANRNVSFKFFGMSMPMPGCLERGGWTQVVLLRAKNKNVTAFDRSIVETLSLATDL